MALSTATFTLYPYPKGVDNTQRYQVLRGTVAVTFGTYPPGGYACNWGALLNPNGERVETDPALTPVEVDFYSFGLQGGQSSGFVYVWDNVSNSGQGSLHVLIAANSASGTSGPLIEGVGANANVPAALVKDTIQFTAIFARQ